jgi:hypothetical protein
MSIPLEAIGSGATSRTAVPVTSDRWKGSKDRVRYA